MDKDKRNLIITLGLLAVLFFAVGKNFLFKQNSGGANPLTQGTRPLSVDSLSVLSQIKKNQSLWDAQTAQWDQEAWGRDPFFAEGSEPGKFSALPLNLSGIVWDAKMPFAVVNNKVLKIGDAIEGYKVIEIKPSSVVFLAGEDKVELQLFRANQPANRD